MGGLRQAERTTTSDYHRQVGGGGVGRAGGEGAQRQTEKGIDRGRQTYRSGAGRYCKRDRCSTRVRERGREGDRQTERQTDRDGQRRPGEKE